MKAFTMVIAVWLNVIVGFAAESNKVPQVFFMIGEPEYGTSTNLPKFAKEELEPRGVHCVFSILTNDASDFFPGMETLKQSDLLFISVRRHAPPPEQMKLIRNYISSGKPVVGIRTASHAFGKKKGAKEGAWEELDHEILGGNYQNHYEKGVTSVIKPVPEMMKHPVLRGVSTRGFTTSASLYKNKGLNPNDTILMTGQLSGQNETEPVAWVNQSNGRRVFYTSLGAPEDFNQTVFRQLLLNGIFWALDVPEPNRIER
jgi:type 1 glutamine amidotransferase